MRRLGLLLALFSILLTGCVPALTVTPSAMVSPALVFSPSPSATFAPTFTLTPETLTPDTRSSSTVETPTVTPLPTIPTFTPTFDVRTIVTATPAPKAECPKENPELVSPSAVCNKNGCSAFPSHNDVLNYLNSGGILDKLENKNWGYIVDLTGDNLKEMVFIDLDALYIFACKSGNYAVLQKFEGSQHAPYADYVADLNNDGIPELIISNYERRYFHSILIVEWNGSEFKSLGYLGGAALDYKIADVNGDSVKEITAIIKIPSADPSALSYGLPWRDTTVSLGWNGEKYVISKEEYAPPKYRFQALQDADELVLEHSYKEAFQQYQNVISNQKLDWWSKDRRNYESENVLETWFQDASKWLAQTATPFPTLPAVSLDSTEYPRLAAYAYYRMIILHTFLGEMDAAQVNYATLQEKFPAGNPGHPYVEMATEFWNAWQSNGKMYNACAAAIAYADAHSEILTPLGSDYHGAQSHKYVPADVCPLR